MKTSQYISRPPDAKGYVHYSDQDNKTWAFLFKRQQDLVQGRACDAYLKGVNTLALTSETIPQIPDVNACLRAQTGWEIAPVPALINFKKFFGLLGQRKFPCATFIRKWEELDYLQEPDVFHEIYGHCPLLTDPVYADFMEAYGQLGEHACHEDQVMLARLYWFTVEFGLINTPKGTRIYGGGILSSKGETEYALDSPIPQRVKLSTLEAFRTPYRIDIFQPIYFVIDNFEDLFNVIQTDLLGEIKEARRLGMRMPLFEPKEKEE